MRTHKRLIAILTVVLFSLSLPLSVYAQMHDISAPENEITEVELPTEKGVEEEVEADVITEVEMPTEQADAELDESESEKKEDEEGELDQEEERQSLEPSEEGISPPPEAVEITFPENIDFFLLSLGTDMEGVVFSEKFFIKNEGSIPVNLELSDIIASVSDETLFNICSEPQLPEQGNNIYIELKGYYREEEVIVPLSAEAAEYSGIITLEPGEEFQFELQGSLNQEDFVWNNEAVKVSISFVFISAENDEKEPEESLESDENKETEDALGLNNNEDNNENSEENKEQEHSEKEGDSEAKGHKEPTDSESGEDENYPDLDELGSDDKEDTDPSPEEEGEGFDIEPEDIEGAPDDPDSQDQIPGEGTAEAPLEIDSVQTLNSFINAYDNDSLSDITVMTAPYKDEPVHVEFLTASMCYLFKKLASQEMIENTVIEVELSSKTLSDKR